MNPRLQRILLFAAYPAFYLFCLMMFAYVSAPYDRIKNAVISGLNKGDVPFKVDIEDLSWSWRFPGLSLSGVKLTSSAPINTIDGKTATRAEYTIDDAYVRVSLLRLLIGTVQVGFGVDAFGGDIDGRVATSSDERQVQVSFDGADVGKMPYITEAVGLPMQGSLNGIVDFTLPEQKFSKAEGSIEISVDKLVVGDGKAKIRDTIAMPALQVGSLKLIAQATAGQLDITEFSASGEDLEFASQGKLRLMDRVDASIADLDLRLKFSDKYKVKNDTTRALFGEPGSKVPGVFDLDPKIAQAKRDDGFYVWHLSGPLARISFQPGSRGTASTEDQRSSRGTRRQGRRGSRLTPAAAAQPVISPPMMPAPPPPVPVEAPPVPAPMPPPVVPETPPPPPPLPEPPPVQPPAPAAPMQQEVDDEEDDDDDEPQQGGGS